MQFLRKIRILFISLAILNNMPYLCIVNDINMMYEQLKLDNQLCFRLYTAARFVTSIYQPFFAPLGITYPQYLVMLVLWEKDKQSVSDICKRLMLDTNTITPLLQRMEKAGLIIRTRGTEDTRQRIVSLTERGLALREQLAKVPDCLCDSISEKIGSVDEMKSLIPTLDKLIEGLSKIQK